MAKKFIQNVIGLEITDDFIYMSLLEFEEDVIQLKKVKSITIPPRSITDGVITDVEMIADQITKTLKDDDFESENIIAAINDVQFIKKLDLIPIDPAKDLLMELEMKVSKNFNFVQSDFQLGYQVYSETALEEAVESSKQAVLYAALKTETIDNLNEFADEIGSQLVSIDLVCLSALRAMIWNIDFQDDVIIYVFVDKLFIDVNFIYKGHVIFSHLFKRDLNEVLDQEYLLEAYVNTFYTCIVQSTNLFPNLPKPSKIIYCTRVPHIQLFFTKLQTLLNIDIEEYKLSTNFKSFVSNLPEEKLNSYSRLYLPSIGLALKYFEKYGKTLSITKVKKKLSPIINIKTFLINFIFFVVILFSFYFANNLLGNLKSNITKDINVVKRQLKVIQSGSFVGQKRQIDSLKSSISTLTEFENEKNSKYDFFYLFSENLSNDIIVNNMSIKKANAGFKISFTGQSKYQESIYTFYDFLSKKYVNVELSSIKTTYDKSEKATHIFSINFNRR